MTTSVADQERALFLHRLQAPLPEGFSRLYFGSEFCPWTFPPVRSIRAALAAAHSAGWRFTLATPVLVEPFLPRLEKTLAQILPLLTEGDEVLVSDLGAIGMVREITPEATVVLGRVLSGQKRGPEILALALSEAQRSYFRQGSWYPAEGGRLLEEVAIGRIELDNLLQGIAPVPPPLCASLHYPFAFVTSSRNCPFRRVSGEPVCAGGCGEVFQLESARTPVPLLQGGNTQFLRHDRLPENPAGLGVDRLVWHPFLPR